MLQQTKKFDTDPFADEKKQKKMLGEDGHGLPPSGMLGENGHGLPPKWLDDQKDNKSTGMLGENGHGLPPSSSGMLGENGHGLPPKWLDNQDKSNKSGTRLGQDGHGLPPKNLSRKPKRNTFGGTTFDHVPKTEEDFKKMKHLPTEGEYQKLNNGDWLTVYFNDPRH